MFPIKFTEDANGTPGFICADANAGFYGLGYLHGHYRPLQTLILATAGRGRLSAELAPKKQLLHIDRLVHRYDLVRIGEAESHRLPQKTRNRLEAYIRGVDDALQRGGVGFENLVLGTGFSPPTLASLLSSFLLASFMGLAESQGRMELALVRALQEGAEEALLTQMFSPHLAGWNPDWLRSLDIPDLSGLGQSKSGGSNAWAVSGKRTSSGAALLAGDPHLQINQLPGLFFEVRGRVGKDYWLGATIPGLPGLAMGRNRNVSWAGTFAVADNLDYQGYDVDTARERTVHIERRLAQPYREKVYDTSRGVSDSLTGQHLAERWAGVDGAADAMTAYLDLMECSSSGEAVSVLERASNFSLHFVLADRAGDIRYTQTGRIPQRSGGWSGLYPVQEEGDQRWLGFFDGERLPRERPRNDILCSANEARPGLNGAVLSTLAQPYYRIERMRSLLLESERHDVKSFKEIQLDLVCLRDKRLRSILLSHMDEGFLKILLSSWDGHCGPQAEGMSVFKVALDAAISVLASRLGGNCFRQMYKETELPIWWCEGLDRALSDKATWTEEFIRLFKLELKAVKESQLAPWGDVQRIRFNHMIFGGLPKVLGFDRGPYSLPGAISTICQGNVFRVNGDEIAIGPAYRFISSMDEDCLHTSLPGGIHGSRFSKTYTLWLSDYLAGRYHKISPPQDGENTLKI